MLNIEDDEKYDETKGSKLQVSNLFKSSFRRFEGYVCSCRPCRDYYAALLRTYSSFVAPTQGPLLNYVQRVPLGVVAQITVSVSVLSMVDALLKPSHVCHSRSTTPSSLPSRRLHPHLPQETLSL